MKSAVQSDIEDFYLHLLSKRYVLSLFLKAAYRREMEMEKEMSLQESRVSRKPGEQGNAK